MISFTVHYEVVSPADDFGPPFAIGSFDSQDRRSILSTDKELLLERQWRIASVNGCRIYQQSLGKEGRLHN